MPAHPAVSPMAALLGLAVAEVELEEPEEFFEVLDAEEVADAPLDVVDALEPAVDDWAPSGAVDCPAISAETDALNLPDIFWRVNLEEKDWSGSPLAALEANDWIRIK